MRSRFGAPTEHTMSIDHRENASGRRYHTIYRSILWNDMGIYLYMSVIWPIKMYSCLIFIISKRNCDASRAEPCWGDATFISDICRPKSKYLHGCWFWIIVLFLFSVSSFRFIVFRFQFKSYSNYHFHSGTQLCVCSESFALSAFRFACFVSFLTTEWTSFYVR